MSLYRLIRDVYGRMIRSRWEIGFVQGGIDAVMSQKELRINWLKHNYKDRWFADPFILDVTESEIVVLVEEVRYHAPKGRIAELVVDRSTFELKERSIILEINTHLSFPAIWRKGNEVYVYPENWQSGELVLYEYEGRGENLKRVRQICNESLADAVMSECLGA